MKKKPADFLKEFDREGNKRRARERKSVLLPVDLILNRALPPSCARVYGALKFLQIGTSPVRISHRRLHELTGLSPNTIAKVLNKLKRAGWLKVENRSGDLNVYDFSTPEERPD